MSPIFFLRVYYDVRILHGSRGAGSAVVGVRAASLVAFRVAGNFDGAAFRAIRSELFALGAGAIIELRIPRLRRSRVPHPGYFVAVLDMDLLVFFQHRS